MIVLWPEIREVKNPATPAHAFTENGRTVIEVDERLKGRERSKAIFAAWREHERGLAALVAMPVLAYLWEPFKRWAADHPLATMAIGITYGGAMVLAIPALLDQDRPIMTPHPVTESSSVDLWTTEQAPAETPTRASHASPTYTRDRPGPIPQRTRDTRRPDTPRRSPAKRSTPGAYASDPESHPSAVPALSASATAGERPTPQPEPSPQPAASPVSTERPPPSASGSRDCLLEVDVDPLLNVCAL